MNSEIFDFCFAVGQDATDLGSVFLGSENHGYLVSESCSRSTRSGRWHCGIILETPGRQFVFMCEQEEERREWMEAFRTVISQPMTPEDYASTMMLLQLKQYRLCQIPTLTPNHFSLFLFVDEASLRRGRWQGHFWPNCLQSDTADVTFISEAACHLYWTCFIKCLRMTHKNILLHYSVHSNEENFVFI